MRHLLELLLLPPCSGALLLLAALLLRRRLPRTARILGLAACAWLWLAASPAIARGALVALQFHPPLPAYGPLPGADAIVVLSAECDAAGEEYGHPVAGQQTLQRLRYAAWLQRRTQMPLLVSGGDGGARWSLAATMAAAAERDFGVPVRWREDRSIDTGENAAFSAAILRQEGYRTVMLVTHAWHMPRAVACFEAHGLEVVPAPTGFEGPPGFGPTDWLPQWHGLRDSARVLHELAGFLQLWLSAPPPQQPTPTAARPAGDADDA